MLLVDAALGKPAQLPRDQYMEKALPGFDSTWALGSQEPNPAEQMTIEDNVVVPVGHIIDSPYKNVSCVEHQYIVYRVDQARIRYLVHFAG
ncbi:hypothetical protein Pelo_19099 [Pelomyxa schiedti]|nr:hypothetical protein Pelo_19099 [Pelomyxa schiedti]